MSIVMQRRGHGRIVPTVDGAQAMERLLRYDPTRLLQVDRLYLASICSAYCHMCRAGTAITDEPLLSHTAIREISRLATGLEDDNA